MASLATTSRRTQLRSFCDFTNNNSMPQTKRSRCDNELTCTMRTVPTKVNGRTQLNSQAPSSSPTKKKRVTKRNFNKSHGGGTLTPTEYNGDCADWNEHDDARLREGVLKHGNDWQLVREYIRASTGCQSRRANDCEKRWSDVVSKRHKKGPWTPDEDVLVCDLVRINGAKKWSTLATFVPGRTGKQCRERWVNHLSPDVNKGEWTPHEEDVLLREHKKLGNQWCKIALALPGRSENAVKNRWNSFANRSSNQQRSEHRRGNSRGRRSKHQQSKGIPRLKKLSTGKKTAMIRSSLRGNGCGVDPVPPKKATKVKVKKNLTPLTIEPCLHTSTKTDQYDDSTDFDAVLMSPDISPMANTFSPVNVLSPVTSPSSLRGFQLSSLAYLWPNSPANESPNKQSLSRIKDNSDVETKQGAETLASINETWLFETYTLSPAV